MSSRVPVLFVALSFLLPSVARADVTVEDYAVYHKLGRRYMVEEKWSLAVEQLQKAIAAKNDDDQVWTDLGDALAVDARGVRFGNPEQNSRAAQAYRRAAQLNPGSGRAWNNLAWLLAKTKTSLDEALAAARRAVEVDEGRAGYLDTLAEVHFARGELADAVDTEDKARGLDPNDAYIEKQYERFLTAQAAPTPTPAPKAAKKPVGKKTPKKGKK